MGPTITEKKCAFHITNHRLLININGQNARHLYNLKTNNRNIKTDFNGPTIISFLSEGGGGIFYVGQYPK